MVKSEKKLSPAKKSCITFSVLGAVNTALGITGLAMSENPLLSVVSGASLAVAGLWGFLAVRAMRNKEKMDAHKTACKAHNNCYCKAKECKAEQKKKIQEQVAKEIPGKGFIPSIKRFFRTQQEYKVQGIPKSAKPYKVGKVTSIVVATLCGLICLTSGVLLADNFISANTYASENNSSTEEHLEKQSVINNSIGIGIAGVSTAGLIVASVAASKMARKREDEMIESYEIH